MDNNENMEFEEQKVVLPIDNLEKTPAFSRFTSALIDAVVYFAVAFALVFCFSSNLANAIDKNYSSYGTDINSHLYGSGLKIANSDREVKTIDSTEYFTDRSKLFLRSDSLIINNVAYYYLSYLTGENTTGGYATSLNKEKTVKNIKGEDVLPKEYYTVSWFNQKILGLPKEGETNESEYFEYKTNELGEIDYDSIGVIQDQYYEEVEGVKRIIKDSKIYEECGRIYQEATNHFYSLDYIVNWQKSMLQTNNITLFILACAPALVLYLIVPLLNKRAKTLGKLVMKQAVVDKEGFLSRKWQIALRIVPLLASLALLTFAQPSGIWMIVCAVILLGSFCCTLFTPNRSAIHDFLAGTIVVNDEDVTLYSNDVEYRKHLENTHE